MTHERSIWARRSLESARLARLRGLALCATFLYGAVLGVRAVDVHLGYDSRLSPWLDQIVKAPRRERIRGNVLDRDARLLIAREDVWSLEAYPRWIADKRQTARLLAEALRVPVQGIRRKLERKDGAAYLHRWLTREEKERIAALDLPGLGRKPGPRATPAGLALVREQRGVYPNGALAGALLGFTGYDETAHTGIELLFDASLRGTEPAVGEAGSDASAASSLEPVRGASVQLALDTPLQTAAEQALAEGLEATGAKHASMVVVDPWTGDILVAAEAPGFDPYAFRETNPEHFRLESFQHTFEPGSPIKVFTMAAALEARAIQPQQTFDCENGRWKVGSRIIRDTHAYGTLDATGVLAHSSNICIGKIANLLGSQLLVSWHRKFGFGEPVRTSFPRTKAGVVRDLGERQAVERINLAFGQGMRASALQIAMAGAALANGGMRVAPRLALYVHRGDRREEVAPAIGPRVVAETTAREVVHMMEQVVVKGTAKGAAVQSYRIAGKTGTAQKPRSSLRALARGGSRAAADAAALAESGEGYSNEVVASFLGILPAENPRLVVVVVMDEPKRPKHTGSEAAVPVFQRFAAYAVERLSIPPDPLLVAQGQEPDGKAEGTPR